MWPQPAATTRRFIGFWRWPNQHPDCVIFYVATSQLTTAKTLLVFFGGPNVKKKFYIILCVVHMNKDMDADIWLFYTSSHWTYAARISAWAIHINSCWTFSVNRLSGGVDSSRLSCPHTASYLDIRNSGFSPNIICNQAHWFFFGAVDQLPLWVFLAGGPIITTEMGQNERNRTIGNEICKNPLIFLTLSYLSKVGPVWHELSIQDISIYKWHI